MTFPPQPDPDNTEPPEFRRYVLVWLAAFNDWHEQVDLKLERLEERTRDIRWIKWGTIATVLIGVAGLFIRAHG